MTSKQKHSITHNDLQKIYPETKNQEIAFEEFDAGMNLVLSGSAGTGKTFIAMYMALEEVLDKESFYDRVIIMRSVVPTRDIGFLPGDQQEKIDIYQAPYRAIANELFNEPKAFDLLVKAGKLSFETTSFIRGLTFDNAIVIVDEMQNMTGHELDSVITRMGNNCRVILCGDYYQSDLIHSRDREGLNQFLYILKRSQFFSTVEFDWKDILRSDLVRDYIMTKEIVKRENIKIEF